MPVINCTTHGWKGCELVSQGVLNGIDHKEKKDAFKITLRFEDIDLYYYVTKEETGVSPLNRRIDEEGIMVFDDEASIEAAMEIFHPVCVECFNEWMSMN